MILAEPTPGHPGPNIWIRIGAFNLALAITAGAFIGIGLRALLLAAMDRASGAKLAALRALKGIIYLALGGYYTYVAWPMIVWDRPARIFFMLTALAPPIVAAVRYSKGGLRGTPGRTRIVLSAILTIVLFVTAALTLLRAGFITLKGDRVAMLMAITGEARSVKAEAASVGNGQSSSTSSHHIILFMQEGMPAADLWISGDRVALSGRAVVFSHFLNDIGFPNLYELQRVTATARNDGTEPVKTYDADLPDIGPLTQRPSWTRFQEAMLRAWPRADEDGSPWWGVRVFENESPFYPLVNPDGTPLKRDFLFDITLDGIPTSRFTSPLEKK